MPRYSLASADVDADGLTDLFVGAPFYHKVGWLPSYVYKGAGSFHIHRKTMKELGALAVLGIRERPNLAQNLVTHRH